jgi:acyl-CoA synthetase (AMP-forming)/AMP-acid ligase II
MNSRIITNIGDTIDPSIDLDRIAIIDLSKSLPDHISYRDLDALSKAVARGLRTKNILPGDKVAILALNSIEYAATFFGTLRLGAIPVLINLKLTVNQIRQILIDSESKMLFLDHDFESDIETIRLDKNFQAFCNFGEFETYQPKKDETAFLLYTSGSYNSPKGAVITHSGHSWTMQGYKPNLQAHHAAKAIALISAPLYHANGLTTLESSIFAGLKVVLLPKFNAVNCLQAISDFKVHIVYAVPTMLAMMLQEKEIIKKLDLSSLRVISMASSPLSKKLVENIRNTFLNAKIYNNYGITEVGPGLFGFDENNPVPSYRPEGSVGFPRKGIEYRIVDGILQIKSPAMMTSYYKQTENESMTQDGFFITNDLFKIDQDGFYYFLGRADDIFKCGGNKVNPEEVEEILESHPAVATSAVIGLEDEIKGKKPYAFVVLEKGKTATQEELINYSLNNGPAYQHPRQIWFLDELPLAGTNKVNKRYLEELAIQLTNQK